MRLQTVIACAHAGATIGEWAQCLREVFGEYRAPTGVARAAGVSDGRLEATRREVDSVSRRLGRRIKMLVDKPGLDGHSNGAEQIAVAGRDAGMEVIYQGIRLTPEQIVESAVEENADVIGASVLSGSHLELADQLAEGMPQVDADILRFRHQLADAFSELFVIDARGVVLASTASNREGRQDLPAAAVAKPA